MRHAMRLVILSPATDLKPLVAGYCLCEDLDGEMAGGLVQAGPQLGAVLCLQLADDVVTDFRDPRPLVSFAGLQSGVRSYQPVGASRSLIVFFTDLGSLRLFPFAGAEAFDTGHDVAGLIGDGPALRMRAALASSPDDALALELDAILRARFAAHPMTPQFARLARAMGLLSDSFARISETADAVGLSVRQVERGFHAHLGLSPKRFQQLHRLHASLKAALTGGGDPVDGYADQAHQIRAWNRYLGFTPGAMRRCGPTAIGRLFAREASTHGYARAHYL